MVVTRMLIAKLEGIAIFTELKALYNVFFNRVDRSWANK